MATLYIKNTPLFDIEIDNGLIVDLGKVYTPELLPFYLQKEFSLKAVNKWMEKRKIPQNRDGLAEARELFPGFEKYRCMFSLSDQYWIRYNKSQTWKKGNFFTNHYRSEVGNMFLAPWLVDRKRIDVENPDLTTNGALKKKWEQDETGISWLYKAGSRKFHQEPIAEVMAAITLKKLKLVEFVDYDLVVEGVQFCSKCKNFIDENTEFVPAKQIYMQEARDIRKDTVYGHLLRMCEKYEIENAKEQIDKMLMADIVLCNNDRHLGNFGFIRDVESGKILRFAPLFDNGSAYHMEKPKKEEREPYFESEKQRLLKRVRKSIARDVLRDTDEIYELLNTYPHISKERKQEIQKSVDATIEQVDRAEKKVRGFELELT